MRHAKVETLIPSSEPAQQRAARTAPGWQIQDGTRSSAFNGQPRSPIGTALPNIGPDQSAGAKLNAESLTRPAVHRLPDFVG